MGGTVNPDNPASRYNGTLAPNDRNEFQFNQLYMVMEKTLNTDDCGWDIGGRVDLLYGTDYIYCESLGFETNPDGSPKWNAGIDYGLAMPQIYAEIGYGKTGPEARPFLHDHRLRVDDGHQQLLLLDELCLALRRADDAHGRFVHLEKIDELSLYLGGVNGQDETDGLVDSFGGLTGFAYTPKDKKYALNFAIMTGGLDPTPRIRPFMRLAPTSART